MIALLFQEAQQDSIQVKKFPLRDSSGQKSDRSSLFFAVHPKDSVRHIIKSQHPKPVPEIADTISVCQRNTIEDVTFYDSNNLVTRIEKVHIDKFPFLFTEKGRLICEAQKTTLINKLKQGTELPLNVLHDDWIILIVLLSVFLYGIIRKSNGRLRRTMERYFLFRGLKDTSKTDTVGLFTWESTLKNLISFLILGLFCYSAASIYKIVPSSVHGIVFWLTSVIIIISAVTIRHLICMITGSISGKKEIFTDYLLSIYQFYRLSAVSLFVVTILISYTTILPVKSYFTAGAIILLTLYFIRVMRLFIIFINKNISLFYLILYLCALEILPVFISVKYISGLG